MKRFLLLILSIFMAPLHASTAVGTPELGRISMALLLVVGLIVILAFALKKINAFPLSSSQSMKTHGMLSIGTRERIALIEVGGRYLLIGIGAGSVNTLHDFGDTLPEGFSGQTQAGFANILKAMLNKSRTGSSS